MFIHANLIVLMGLLTLHGQVHSGKIVGGHEAVAHSQPYMAFLEINKGRGDKSFCGGFLLSEDFVMTAAHCQAKNYTVMLGLHNLHDQSNIQRIPVKHSFPHKEYNDVKYTNDVMILKLSYKAKLNNNVTTIEIADWKNGSLPTSCIVSGWGRTKKNGMLSSKLMETNITLVNNKNCPEESFYCSLGDSRPDEGDSGGPLVCEGGKAYGLVCGLFKPKDTPIPVFRYTKISEYKEWIISTLKEAMEKN